MRIDEIRELAAIMRESGLSAIEIDECGAHIKLERAASAAPVAAAPAPAPAPAPVAAPEPAAPHSEGGVDFNDVVEIKSPLVGVFYAAPSPDSEPYVKVGDRVKKGDVLCIVEAMKLMNEITATQDGEIVDICAQSGSVVEYGQTLFTLY